MLRIQIQAPECLLQQAKQSADRFAEWFEKNWNLAELAQTSLHEAVHWHYARQLGLACKLYGPAVIYNPKTDRFDWHTASVDCLDQQALLTGATIAVAKFQLAPALVCLKMTGRSVARIEEGCTIDMRECRNWWKVVWRGRERFKYSELTEEEAFHRLLNDVRISVLRDLQSPAFRCQLWDCAREFEIKVFGSVESPNAG